MAAMETGYTHAIFSDFSGDDGQKFDKGSSRTLGVVWVASRESDVPHNTDVVYRIKRAVGCKPNDELKYRSLRGSARRKTQALALMLEARVDVFALLAFKMRERDPSHKDPAGKGLVVHMNAWPVDILIDAMTAKYGTVRPRLVLDEVGWKATPEQITSVMTEGGRVSAGDVEFRPSAGTPLLQMSDLFAGAVRECADQLDQSVWPPCQACWGRSFTPRDCRWKRRKIGISGFALLRKLYPSIFKDSRRGSLGRGLFTMPGSLRRDLEFVDCLLLPK
jgi:hypothetical protein